MPIVAACLLPGSPLPLLVPENPPWVALVGGMEEAGRRLAASEPDVIVVYSTQWLAVLDQLWQIRERVEGVHVDDTWHEYGEIPFSLQVDAAFAEACIAHANHSGLRSRSVDFDAFPIDTGTLVASRFLDPSGRASFAMTSNNLYHDRALTRRIGGVVRDVAESEDRRVAVVGVGALSGTLYRDDIDISVDTIASPDDDTWNRRILHLIETGEIAELEARWDEFANNAKVDMGFKHMAFLLGALGGTYSRAEVLAYGPTYGAGAAVVTIAP